MTVGELKKLIEHMDGYDHLPVVVKWYELNEDDGDDYRCSHLVCFRIEECCLQPWGKGKGLEVDVDRAVLEFSFEGG